MSVAPKRRLVALAVLALLIGVVAVNAPGLAALYYTWRYVPLVAALPAAPAYRPDDRVLVVSPHPDDESLCCAGTIQQALAVGAEVYVVWLTSGDGFELDAVVAEETFHPGELGMRDLGTRRIAEAREAARRLGIPEANLFFLGYPDGGLQRLFLDYYFQTYTSSYTGESSVTYPGALSPGVTFTGENLVADLTRVLEQVNPTVVLAPSPEDAHPDHRTAGDMTLRILGERGEVGKVRWWIVHGGLEWPLPKGWHPNLPLYPPPRAPNLPWQRVNLSPEQVEVKAEAVRAHRTQLEVIGRFMEAFTRTNELISLEPLAP